MGFLYSPLQLQLWYIFEQTNDIQNVCKQEYILFYFSNVVLFLTLFWLVWFMILLDDYINTSPILIRQYYRVER